jgi:hypothetical protein
MSLDEVIAHQIDYAICSDVGASPTTSLAAEMAVFLLAHRGRSRHATACEALYRTTLGPAKVLGIDSSCGHFAVGGQAVWAEWPKPNAGPNASAEEWLQWLLLPRHQTDPLPAGILELPNLQNWIAARRSEPMLKPLRVRKA